ncbi:hypothetical protein MSKU3_0219 [Komagataeibacter oboediens]|nr:hypothetical protein MSKU3_0219 [Komagataeibacter oboediens]
MRRMLQYGAVPAIRAGNRAIAATGICDSRRDREAANTPSCA